MSDTNTTDEHREVPFTLEEAQNGWAFHLREQQAKIDEAKDAAVKLALQMIDDLYWTTPNANDEVEIDKLRQVAAVIHCLEDLGHVEFDYAMYDHVTKLAAQAEEVDA